VTLAAAVVNRANGIRWRAGPIGIAITAYGASFLIGMFIGISRGGFWNESAALAEIRGPLYLCATYFLAANLVRTRADTLRMGTFFVLLVSIKAVQAMWNAAVMFESGLRLEAVTSHEDVVFFDVVLVLAFAALIVRGRSWTTYGLLAAVPPILAAELLTQRRVGFIALGAAMTVAVLCLAALRPQRTLAIVIPVLVGLVVYCGVFWNSTSPFAQPVRAVKGIISPESISERDRLSNYWRDIENANIAFTLQELPVTGVGLGQEYLFKTEPFAQLTGFTYWRYMTHNAVFWVWLKGGVIAFFAFWLLVGQATVAAARLVRQLQQPSLVLVALFPLAIVVGQVAFSAVDLGLTYSRCMIVLGVGLGLLAPLASFAPPNPSDVQVEQGVAPLRVVPAPMAGPLRS
jgi:hypothetical protein